MTPQNKDIVITDFSSSKKTELFEKNLVAQTFTVHHTINVNLSVLVFSLHEEITVKKDEKDLQSRKIILKDNTDKISGVFFESKTQ